MTLEDDSDLDDRLINGKDATSAADIDPKIAIWSEKVREKYNALHNVVLDNLPDLWTQLEFALSVKTVLNIKGCTLPFAGIILGPPGSLKTAVIQLFRGYKHAFYTDSFTSKSIISHNSAVKKEKLKEIDMLPRMENKVFLTPELAPVFSARDETLLETLGLLTKLLDGHGYESDTGAQGHRGYNRDIMFTWLGAAVEIPYKVHKHLSALGPKIYFFRLPRIEHTEEDYEYYCKYVSDNFPERLDKIKFALIDYTAYFEMHPLIEQTATIEEENKPPKIPFNDPNEDLIDLYLIKLANLLSRLRATVPTWHTEGSQGSEYAYGIPIIEDPSRAITQLKNLSKAHALSQGRSHMTPEDDLNVVIKTVLSTCPVERSIIFDVLIANKGTLTTTEVCDYLNTTKPTALRTMTELKAVGLVTMYDGDNNSKAEIELKPEFGWFTTDRFDELRYEKSRKEKYTPRAQPPSISNLLYYSTINNKIIRKWENSLCESESIGEYEPTRGGEISLCENNHVDHSDEQTIGLTADSTDLKGGFYASVGQPQLRPTMLDSDENENTASK